VIIDAGATKEEVANQVWAAVNSRLEPAMAATMLENVAS
jgi:hypothetical protein